MSAKQKVKTTKVVRKIRRRKVGGSTGFITCPFCHGSGRVKKRR